MREVASAWCRAQISSGRWHAWPTTDPSVVISTDAPHGALGAVQPGDVVILFSKGGGTTELLSLVPSLRTKNAFLVAVTENEASALARESDLVLKVKVEREADDFNMLATTSTMAVVAVFDAICIALMEYLGYTKQQFAVIHPHGAVGDRLTGGTS